MEVSPQFCVVQQEPEESIFAQEKPELPSMLAQNKYDMSVTPPVSQFEM